MAVRESFESMGAGVLKPTGWIGLRCWRDWAEAGSWGEGSGENALVYA